MRVDKTSFEDLNLIEPLLSALRDEGYEQPTPIQVETIPNILLGRDIIGCAQTGTGKTAAFALPIMQRLEVERHDPESRYSRVLVLTPTRELAAQIGESFRTYGRHLHQRQAIVFGGVGQARQVKKMADGVEVLIATPGRLLDLIDQGHIRLGKIEIFVLDEADRMLDMGFIHDIQKIIKMLPSKRQSLFFSATMPKEIISLAGTILTNPFQVSVTPESPTVELIDQKVMFVDRNHKIPLLKKIIIEEEAKRVLVFTRTKHMADKVASKLSEGKIQAQAIHGNKGQTARMNALRRFRDGRTPVLVATDIAARGIDVDDITHVFNFEIPEEPGTYVHRIGRTGRAGASGSAISFCEAQERESMRDIEDLIKRPVPVVEDHPFHSVIAMNATGKAARRPPKRSWNPRQKAGNRRRHQSSKSNPRKRENRRRY